MSQNDTQKKRKVKPEGRPVIAENGFGDYSWGSLPLAIQLILPLAIITLIIGRRGIGIRPYPVLDTYVSLICPSFKQKQRLLKWMSDRIPHMPNKMGEYWRDGSLLCTLINTAVPGACPNPQRHWRQPPSHGQALAFKYLGVAPMLNEEHFKEKTFNSQTEKSFFKYLLAVQEAIAKLDAKENTELKYTSKYVARGMGLFTGEKNRASVFYIYPNSRLKKMRNVLVNLKGPYSAYGTQTISAQHLFRTMDLVKKVQKDVRREQKNLTVPSKAQRSFFRSLSIDLGPLANIISNRKSNDEIKIKVEIEEGRTKVSFIPPHTGVYELCLTTDGEHLTGSPFNIRVTKNDTNIVDSFETDKRSHLRKTGKIISKCITFFNESVRVTNNNDVGCFGESSQNQNSNLTLMTSTKILCKLDEDTNSYEHDSGVFDANENTSEISDFNETQQSEMNKENVEVFRQKNHQSVVKREMGINETDPKEIGEVSAITPEEALNVISNMIDLPVNPESKEDAQNNAEDKNLNYYTNLKQSVKDVRKKDTFDLMDLKSNAEFEDLYNKYIKDDEEEEEEAAPTILRDAENFGINTELRLLKKVSNVRAVKQIFESVSPKTLVNPDVITCHSQRKHLKKASPVSQGIEQEVEKPRSPPRNATRPSRDGASFLAEEKKREQNVDLSEEVGEINVVKIRARFEGKGKTGEATKTKTLRKNNCDVDLLKETSKHLAVSLPNLITNDLSSTVSNSLESISSEDEDMSLKFRERYHFWKDLSQRNSSVSGLNLATSDFGSSDSFVRTKTLSRSTYSLERKSESATQGGELKKRLSTDEKIFPSVKDMRNYYLSNFNRKEKPHFRNVSEKESAREMKEIPRALIKINCDERKDLIYDRIKVYEKASNLNKKGVVIGIGRDRKETNQHDKSTRGEEDIDFADMMRQRFEKSRQYFKSLEALPTMRKPKGTLRRSSLDDPNGTVRKVYDRFSVDNLYRDVMSAIVNRSSFKGSPNRSAVADTLASISSRASSFEGEVAEDSDLDFKYFQMKKRTRERKSIRTVFDINY